MILQKEKKLPIWLLFGPPGSGKGTLGRKLAFLGDHVHLSSGDIFRGLSLDSPSGKLYYQYASKGELVPDRATLEICHTYVFGLVATNQYFPSRQLLLLDGLPRTMEQAIFLDQWADVQRILILEIKNREILFDRLTKRAKIENRQDDQNRAILKRRMEIYDRQTKEVLSHYPQEKILSFNGEQKPLEIVRDVLTALCATLSS